MTRPAPRPLVGLKSASRCGRQSLPKPEAAAQLNGLRFERRVVSALSRALAGLGFKLEHNPWFEFSDDLGPGHCCPDLLLHLNDGRVIIIEVKLTWVRQAQEKLTGFYSPILAKALKLDPSQIQTLVIVRNLTPEAPLATHEFWPALAQTPALLQWLGYGPLLLEVPANA